MTELQFDLAGFDEYEKAMARMIQKLTDLRGFWPRLTPLWKEWMRERFATEGLFGGDGWEPLSDAYWDWKIRNFGSKGILSLTGQLKRQSVAAKRVGTPTSLTFVIEDFSRKPARSARGRFKSNVFMEIGWFQRGTGTMPARQIVPDRWNMQLPTSMEGQVDALAVEYIEDMAHRLGLS